MKKLTQDLNWLVEYTKFSITSFGKLTLVNIFLGFYYVTDIHLMASGFYNNRRPVGRRKRPRGRRPLCSTFSHYFNKYNCYLA